MEPRFSIGQKAREAESRCEGIVHGRDPQDADSACNGWKAKMAVAKRAAPVCLTVLCATKNANAAARHMGQDRSDVKPVRIVVREAFVDQEQSVSKGR